MAFATQSTAPIDRRQGCQITDIWEDVATLHMLMHGKAAPGLEVAQLQRSRRRASRYQLQGQELYIRGMDGKPRLGPKPPKFVSWIKIMHEETWHFGTKRTLALLLT